MIRVTVSNESQHAAFKHDEGAIERGRGQRRELPRFTIKDPYVSRDQLLVEPLGEGRARLTNLAGPSTVADDLQRTLFHIEQTAASSPREIDSSEMLDLALPVRGLHDHRPAVDSRGGSRAPSPNCPSSLSVGECVACASLESRAMQ